MNNASFESIRKNRHCFF